MGSEQIVPSGSSQKMNASGSKPLPSQNDVQHVPHSTGVGKSFVACALAQKACRDGYAALYTRAQSLFRDLAMARAMAVCAVCWRGLAALMSSSSTTGPWLRCPSPSAAISGRSAKIGVKCAQPSLRRNCRFHAGTSRSAIPHWLTASSTGWSTMRIGSRCGVIRCARVEVKRMDRTHSLQGGSASLSMVIRVARMIFDSRRKPEYPYTPRTWFRSRVAVAARGTHVEMARAVFRSTPPSVRQLIEPTPTQDHWHALFRPRCSGFCLLRG